MYIRSKIVLIVLASALLISSWARGSSLVVGIETRVATAFGRNLDLYYFTKDFKVVAEFPTALYLLPKLNVPFNHWSFAPSGIDLAGVNSIFSFYNIGLTFHDKTDLPLDFNMAVKETSEWLRMTILENLDTGFSLETFDHDSRIFRSYLLNLAVLFEMAGDLLYKTQNYGQPSWKGKIVGNNETIYQVESYFLDDPPGSVAGEALGQLLLLKFLRRVSDPAGPTFERPLTKSSEVDLGKLIAAANMITQKNIGLGELQYFTTPAATFLNAALKGIAQIRTYLSKLPDTDPYRYQLMGYLDVMLKDYNILSHRFFLLPPIDPQTPKIWEDYYWMKDEILSRLNYPLVEGNNPLF